MPCLRAIFTWLIKRMRMQLIPGPSTAPRKKPQPGYEAKSYLYIKQLDSITYSREKLHFYRIESV